MIEKTVIKIESRLANLPPFNQLKPSALSKLCEGGEMLRYRMGQMILVREQMPAFISIIYEGEVRLLGYDRNTQTPVTLKMLELGDMLGVCSLVRGLACETAIASEDVVCINLPASNFLQCLKIEKQFSNSIKKLNFISEIFEILSLEFNKQASIQINVKELAFEVYEKATILNLRPGKIDKNILVQDQIWFVSSGSIAGCTGGNRLYIDEFQQSLRVESKQEARLIGLPYIQLSKQEDSQEYPKVFSDNKKKLERVENISYAPEQPATLSPEILSHISQRGKYPYVRGRGKIDSPLACFAMLSKYVGVNFRKDIVRKILENQLKTTGTISLTTCGSLAEMMGFHAQLLQVSSKVISRLRAPALIRYLDGFAILYSISQQELVIAIPEVGILHKNPSHFAELWGEEGQVLLLQAPKNNTTKEKFSLRWFIPSIYRYRKVLTEVLIASFFVQLFGLANPLITQVIIDKVIIQGGRDALNVLGIFLLGVALFEALLTGVRTYLFVDTTNRIDLSLGSEVIEHLLRLPLKYFDRRRVGELAGRVNELENIRQFLTGTALTVVLDAIFSVIYIAVMLFYSWLLTIVALITVPLFAVLTILVSPVIRRQLNVKAERYADTQSYLVEVVSGIQTVKAQNLELKSRWDWYQRYARYISAGFQTVVTSTTASSISGFLNKFSGLLLLWVGASLVLENQLTLGQLIAFRIIAGYVTSPLLRLVQLWQNFQETALSIDRLSDILDTPAEVDETNRTQLPMPEIKGRVEYQRVSFGFNTQGTLQLTNINLDLAAGCFVGVVGQSGSGKSTLTKLLQRLYEPTGGQILIDGYDINKVELYSLRRQIGTVLQDTLLFNGTVQENIALTNPEASTEEIIKAAKIAAAHDFIMSLPNGYNTMVGERGSSLSGGQKQRIAIARIVLQNPQLLILDEATSALDYNSERLVCDNLADAFAGRTVFFITHRLSTVRNADVILVMNKGAVVEQGTHRELMALKGRYYCLYQQQDSSV
jgi:ATP-binding cassette, subfamily B, bacterial HlyB/CyaB